MGARGRQTVTSAIEGSLLLAAEEGCVAHLLPPTAEQPDPYCFIPFIKAMVFYPLMPKRHGPHLAVDRLGRAVLAHTVAMVLSIIIIAAGVIDWSAVPRWAEMREAVAAWVLDQAANSMAGTWDWHLLLLALASVPMLEVGLVLIAVLAMPWGAGGDGTRSVFARSVKNVYWSTTALVPGALVWSVAYRLQANVPPYGGEALLIKLAATLLSVFVGIWWLRCLVVGAGRYVGPPDGPAFSPRAPRCEECGYLIVGLPLASNCPECGLLGKESLPGGRRRPTRWQETEVSAAGFADLLRLQVRVLRDRSFFKTLPVQSGFRAARHFWWGTFLLLAGGSLLLLKACSWAADDRSVGLFALLSMLALGVPFAMQVLMMPAACLWAQARHGIRDYRVSAVVCYYASPTLWGMAVLIPAIWVLSLADVQAALTLQVGGFLLEGAWVALLLWGVMFLLLVLFWWSRLDRGLRDVRYANG